MITKKIVEITPVNIFILYLWHLQLYVCLNILVITMISILIILKNNLVNGKAVAKFPMDKDFENYDFGD